jgi:hypothetical protein
LLIQIYWILHVDRLLNPSSNFTNSLIYPFTISL